MNNFNSADIKMAKGLFSENARIKNVQQKNGFLSFDVVAIDSGHVYNYAIHNHMFEILNMDYAPESLLLDYFIELAYSDLPMC